MKVLLINPPNLHFARISTGWDLEIGNIGLFPPYGLISLAAYVRRERGDEVRVLDCIAEGLDFQGLGCHLSQFAPEVVGITAFTYTFYDVLKTAQLVRQVLPQAHICLGGPHTMLFPQETLTHTEFDSLVLGDGEAPFTRLLDQIEGKGQAEEIQGLVFRHQDIPLKVPRAAWEEDLDSLPFPAFDLIPGEAYSSTFGRAGKMACICTSRGCPFHCTFCQVLVKKFRKHSVPYVMEMMQHLYGQGYRNFYFFDDLFNISTERVIDICEALLASRMQINWVFRGRADQISKEMLQVAARAGCCQILLGVEDYTNAGLKAIRKGITMEQVRQAVAWAHACGLEVSTNWIIGLPRHRSVRDIRDLAQVSLDTGADYAQYSILQLLPGCQMFEEAVLEGIIHREAWTEYVLNPVPHYQIEAYDKYLSVEELSQLYKECHDRFYKRPAYLLGRLRKVRSLGELVTKAKVGLKVLWG